MLLFPESDAEALLGREVQKSSDGSLTIADSRAPGCEVSVRHEKVKFHTSRRLDAHSLTSLAAGYARLVSIEVKFGRKTSAEIDVENAEVVYADMRGNCGDMVVATVFVGHGRRSIKASAESGGSASVSAGIVSTTPNVNADQSLADSIEWRDDQAYGFATREGAKTDPLDLRVDVPSILDEGTSVRARISARLPVWLVVYCIDADGHADVVWPSNEEPEPNATPAVPAVLPSERERMAGIRYAAALTHSGTRSRETLVVYAFADKRDFDALKPAAQSQSPDGPNYVSELTKKLQNVSMSRWSRATVEYVVQPGKR